MTDFLIILAQAISLGIAVLLPSVGVSIYVWSYEADESIDQTASPISRISLNEPVVRRNSAELKAKFSWRRARKLLWEHFIQAYSNKTILIWSIWWSLAMAGFLQIQSYVQLLWQEIYGPDNENIFNGAIEAAMTLFGAISCLVAGFIPSEMFERFDLWILTACSLVEGVMIIIASQTDQIWVAYAMYVLFGIVYMYMITLASATIAKNLADDIFALIFGINTLLALVIQVALTILVVSESGFKLSPRGQFLVFGSYFVGLALIYLIGSIIKQIRK